MASTGVRQSAAGRGPVVAAVLVVALLVAGCAASSGRQLSAPPKPSGIRGTSTLRGGGAQGVGTAGPDPMEAAIVVRPAAASAGIVATATTDKSGAYRIDLPPGRYTVEWAHGSAFQTRTVDVVPGKYAIVDFQLTAF